MPLRIFLIEAIQEKIRREGHVLDPLETEWDWFLRHLDQSSESRCLTPGKEVRHAV